MGKGTGKGVKKGQKGHKTTKKQEDVQSTRAKPIAEQATPSPTRNSPPANTAVSPTPSVSSSISSVSRKRINSNETENNGRVVKVQKSEVNNNDVISSPFSKLVFEEKTELSQEEEDALLNGMEIEEEIGFKPTVTPDFNTSNYGEGSGNMFAEELKKIQQENQRLMEELAKAKADSSLKVMTPDDLRNDSSRNEQDATDSSSGDEDEDGDGDDDMDEEFNLVLCPENYPEAVISDDMMKKIEVIMNGLFKKWSDKFSMQGITIDSCRYGAIFLNCKGMEVCDRVTALVDTINWRRHGLAKLICVSPNVVEFADVLELWIPTKGETFDDAKAMAMKQLSLNTSKWQLIKRTDVASRKGMTFIFASDNSTARKIAETGPIRFRYGFFVARAAISIPQGYKLDKGNNNRRDDDEEEEDQRVMREALRKAEQARKSRTQHASKH